jgi:hypothetical protein
MIVQIFRTNRVSTKDTYTLNRQIPIGQFDIVANTRSFGAWANQLTDGDTSTAYIQGASNTPYWPSEHVICLNGLYEVDRIEIWDVGGGANFIIKSGLKFHSGYTSDANITLDQNTKRTFNLSGKSVRFISLTVNQTKQEVSDNGELRKGPSEIRVYGKQVSVDVIPPVVNRPNKTFQSTLGWNQDLFADQRQNIYNNYLHPYPKTHFRVYELVKKFISPDGAFPGCKFSFSDGYVQGVKYDQFFQKSFEGGIAVIPSMIELASEGFYKASYDAVGEDYSPFFQPRLRNASSTDPNSYIVPAIFCNEFARRYGTKCTTPSTRLDPVRETLNLYGTGWCNRLEFGNELDNWFFSEKWSYLPAELAALVSACVDGHGGTMGPNVGALAADDEFEMILPAFADYSIDFLRAMNYWWIENRPDHKAPKVSLNFHGYFNSGGGQFVEGSKLIAPEKFLRAGVNDGKPGVRNFTDIILERAKRDFPNAPIYLTEFGCDTNKYSPVGVKLPTQAEAALQPHPQDSWQRQAAWNLRTILELRAGTSIDYATIFTLFDYQQNGNELREFFSDVDGNPTYPGWLAGGYGADKQFNTSGGYTGEFGFRLLTLDSKTLQADYDLPSMIELRDPADNTGVGGRLYTNYVSDTDTTLTLQVAGNGPGGINHVGSGSFSTWRIDTPYAKKTAHFVLKNAFQVLSAGNQLLIREDSTSEYRYQVWGDGTVRETHILWLPDDNGTQITRTINFGRSTACKYRDLESKTFSDATFTLTGSSANVVINEMPKMFFFDLGSGNTTPTVDVEANRSLTTGATSTTITSTSSDSDGTIAARLWTKESGGTATLANTTTGTLSLSNLANGTYVFKLTVTDNLGATASDQMTLTVSGIATSTPPTVAYLGTINASSTTVDLYDNGSGPNVISFLWTRISGPNTPGISGANTNHATLTGLVNGTYIYRETVTDNGGLSTSTGGSVPDLVINISGIGANAAPVVAVSNKSVGSSSTTITASATDSDGTIASYLWTKVSGGPATLSGTTTATLSLTGLTTGSYVFGILVTDDDGATDYKTMTLTVTIVGGGSSTSQYVDYDHVSAIGPGGVVIPTLVYLPVGYGSGAKFPVIVACGGLGEKIDTGLTRTQNFNNIKSKFIFRYLGMGHDIPFVVVMPMISFAEFDSFDGSQSGPNWSPGLVTNELAQYAVDHYDGDPQRCHLTGLSLGGQTICNSAIAYPNRWATCTVIASYVQGSGLAGPVRAVFNAIINQDDNQYLEGPPYNYVAWIGELNRLGNIPFPSTYTVYASGGHSGWNETYDLTAASKTLWVNGSVPNNTPFFNPYTWMLKYKIVGGVVSLY